MSWWNPFSWLPEDPVTRCGWYFISLYSDPKKDPYYEFCEFDDLATSKGSAQERDVPLDRYIQTGLAQLRLIQSRQKPDSFAWTLGEFYMHAWPKLVALFWEGKR